MESVTLSNIALASKAEGSWRGVAGEILGSPWEVKC